MKPNSIRALLLQNCTKKNSCSRTYRLKLSRIEGELVIKKKKKQGIIHRRERFLRPLDKKGLENPIH